MKVAKPEEIKVDTELPKGTKDTDAGEGAEVNNLSPVTPIVTPDEDKSTTPQAPEPEVIVTVDFKFNKNVKLDKVLIKAGETVEVTFEEAEEFENAGHGVANW